MKQRRLEIGSERAQTMAEFAIVAPLLLVVLLAIVQFGVVWNHYLSVTDAARVGARKASVSRHSNPSSEGCAAARSSAATLDQAQLTCTITVAGPLDRPGADVTVRVTYPYELKLFGMGLTTGTLEAETTERIE